LKANFKNKKKEISIYFTKDKNIKKINKTYRNKNKVTDVLSFSVPKSFLPYSSSLGDIVISVETARRNAFKDKILYTKELLRLTIHGVLHLLGYEHENVSKKKKEEMFKLQELILKEVF
jgi:probable rRNA maturation factor